MSIRESGDFLFDFPQFSKELLGTDFVWFHDLSLMECSGCGQAAATALQSTITFACGSPPP